MVIFQRVSDRGIDALKNGLSGYVVTVSAAVHDKAPNTVAVIVQLILDFIGSVGRFATSAPRSFYR